MKAIEQMSNKELMKELKAMDQQINDIGCFGIKDLMWQRELEVEADKREL